MGTNSPIRCVNFPSHIPEIWEQLTGHFGRFDQAVQAITAAIEEGGLVAVVHEVTAASIRALPDLVRYVDDNFRDGAGLILKGSVDPQHLPYWHAAIATAEARELYFEAGPELPETDHPGLRTEPLGEPDLPAWVQPLRDPPRARRG